MTNCPICGRKMIFDKEDKKYFCSRCRTKKYTPQELFWRDR